MASEWASTDDGALGRLIRLNGDTSHFARRPLRLWHIAEIYPPEYGGGAALYVRDVCRGLADRGHDVRVLTAEADADRPDYSVRTEILDGVRVDRLNLRYFRELDPAGSRLGVLAWRRHKHQVRRRVESLLGSWRPDLVNFHTPYSLFEECLPLIEAREAAVVGMAHCAWLICPRLNLIRSPLREPCSGPGPVKCLECVYSHWDGSHTKALLKLPWRIARLGASPAYRLWERRVSRGKIDGLVTYSSFMKSVHSPYVRAPVEFIPLGIDLSTVPAERPSRPRVPLRFGFAGGFQVHKGIIGVLEAAAQLQNEGRSFELHIWGPKADWGRQEIVARSLEKTVFAEGFYAPEAKWAAFADMDVHLMASQVEEAYGRVIQEAAAVGAPSIAPAIGGIREQIRDGLDGLLYPFRDQQGLEDRMRRVLNDPGLVARLSANLGPVVDTRDAIVQVEAFYRSVLEGDGHREVRA